MKMFYLAYGSNLNLNDMKKRCPKLKVVDTYILDNYKLTFKGPSKGCAYLTIEESANNKVPCVLYYLTESDVERLDLYEDYPSLYTKKYVKVFINEKEVYALIYIMNPKKGYNCNIPSKRYLENCLKGYQDFSLDKVFLIEAYYDTKEEIRKNNKTKQYYK